MEAILAGRREGKVVPRIRHTVTPHFRVKGVRDLIAFLEQAFGATEEFRAPRPDGLIAHAQVRIGDSIVEMGDATAQYNPHAFGIHLYDHTLPASEERIA